MSQQETQIINQFITRLLSRREHSQVELHHKLIAKGFDRELCVKQIALFTSKDIQSDLRFCESFIRSHYRKGKGPSVIKQQLRQHEIDENLIESMLNDEQYDWYQLAIEVREKKFSLAKVEDFNEKQKQMRFLQYRGFEQAHIKEAFS